MHPKRSEGQRWWQQLVTVAALEHDEAGKLCWDTILIGTPRQVGKSWLIREHALWRMEQEELFEEVQTIVHTASALKQVRGIWLPAAYWCGREGGYRVRFANGTEELARDLNVWLPQAATENLGVGLSVNLAIIDEAWGIEEGLIANSIVPAQISASNPQMMVFTTAGRHNNGHISSLYPSYKAAGLSEEATRSTLVIEWGAVEGADPSTPANWKAASPYWDEQRERVMAREWSKAMTNGDSGVESFSMQYLNVWPRNAEQSNRWLPSYQTARSEGKVGDAPEDAVMAVESFMDGSRWSVAAAWPHTKGRVRARVWSVSSAREAAAIIGDRQVWCYSGVAAVPELMRRPIKAMSTSTARAATGVLRNVMAENRITVMGVPDSTWQGVRTLPADGGEVISRARSKVDVSGVKALSWCVLAVQSEREHSGSLVM